MSKKQRQLIATILNDNAQDKASEIVNNHGKIRSLVNTVENILKREDFYAQVIQLSFVGNLTIGSFVCQQVYPGSITMPEKMKLKNLVLDKTGYEIDFF